MFISLICRRVYKHNTRILSLFGNGVCLASSGKWILSLVHTEKGKDGDFTLLTFRGPEGTESVQLLPPLSQEVTLVKLFILTIEVSGKGIDLVLTITRRYKKFVKVQCR